jgi:hypothetical protein
VRVSRSCNGRFHLPWRFRGAVDRDDERKKGGVGAAHPHRLAPPVYGRPFADLVDEGSETCITDLLADLEHSCRWISFDDCHARLAGTLPPRPVSTGMSRQSQPPVPRICPQAAECSLRRQRRR